MQTFLKFVLVLAVVAAIADLTTAAKKNRKNRKVRKVKVAKVAKVKSEFNFKKFVKVELPSSKRLPKYKKYEHALPPAQLKFKKHNFLDQKVEIEEIAIETPVDVAIGLANYRAQRTRFDAFLGEGAGVIASAQDRGDNTAQVQKELAKSAQETAQRLARAERRAATAAAELAAASDRRSNLKDQEREAKTDLVSANGKFEDAAIAQAIAQAEVDKAEEAINVFEHIKDRVSSVIATLAARAEDAAAEAKALYEQAEAARQSAGEAQSNADDASRVLPTLRATANQAKATRQGAEDAIDTEPLERLQAQLESQRQTVSDAIDKAAKTAEDKARAAALVADLESQVLILETVAKGLRNKIENANRAAAAAKANAEMFLSNAEQIEAAAKEARAIWEKEHHPILSKEGHKDAKNGQFLSVLNKFPEIFDSAPDTAEEGLALLDMAAMEARAKAKDAMEAMTLAQHAAREAQSALDQNQRNLIAATQKLSEAEADLKMMASTAKSAASNLRDEKNRLADLQEAVAAEEERLADLRDALDEARAAEQTAFDAVAVAENLLKYAEALAQVRLEQANNLKWQADRFQALANDLRGKIAATQAAATNPEEVARLEKDLDQAKEDLEDAQEDFDLKRERLSKAQFALANIQVKIQEQDMEVQTLVVIRDITKEEVKRITFELEKLTDALVALSAALKGLEALIPLGQRLTDLAARHADALDAFDENLAAGAATRDQARETREQALLLGAQLTEKKLMLESVTNMAQQFNALAEASKATIDEQEMIQAALVTEKSELKEEGERLLDEATDARQTAKVAAHQADKQKTIADEAGADAAKLNSQLAEAEAAIKAAEAKLAEVDESIKVVRKKGGSSSKNLLVRLKADMADFEAALEKAKKAKDALDAKIAEAKKAKEHAVHNSNQIQVSITAAQRDLEVLLAQATITAQEEDSKRASADALKQNSIDFEARAEEAQESADAQYAGSISVKEAKKGKKQSSKPELSTGPSMDAAARLEELALDLFGRAKQAKQDSKKLREEADDLADKLDDLEDQIKAARTGLAQLKAKQAQFLQLAAEAGAAFNSLVLERNSVETNIKILKANIDDTDRQIKKIEAAGEDAAALLEQLTQTRDDLISVISTQKARAASLKGDTEAAIVAAKQAAALFQLYSSRAWAFNILADGLQKSGELKIQCSKYTGDLLEAVTRVLAFERNFFQTTSELADEAEAKIPGLEEDIKTLQYQIHALRKLLQDQLNQALAFEEAADRHFQLAVDIFEEILSVRQSIAKLEIENQRLCDAAIAEISELSQTLKEFHLQNKGFKIDHLFVMPTPSPFRFGNKAAVVEVERRTVEVASTSSSSSMSAGLLVGVIAGCVGVLLVVAMVSYRAMSKPEVTVA